MIPVGAAQPPRRWTAAELWARSEWRITAPPEIAADIAVLRRWAAGRPDPLDALDIRDMPLPHVRALADRIHRELERGSGVAWVRGIGETDPSALRFLYVAIGLCIGRPVGAYGRLYDVKDSGRSYLTEAIPVSQTRASTGVHTDSSNKGLCPRFVALLCIRPSQVGGGSRITSALQAHEQLRRNHPDALAALYEDHIRDLVTPGATRNADTIRANAFPVFAPPPAPAFRYMRYWIERGHREAGRPLPEERLAAFDLLDEALEHPDHVVRFRLEAGQMLFVDNTIVAHDRDAYEPEPDAPRWLCRLWLQPEAP
jgi:alpha-ketoglutarate-dependent taurine dioxygenase